MDADEAINVFDAASSQTLSINTDGNVLRGNLEMGHSNATVDVTAGRITSDGAAGIWVRMM